MSLTIEAPDMGSLLADPAGAETLSAATGRLSLSRWPVIQPACHRVRSERPM
jgi:hypothetical protein